MSFNFIVCIVFSQKSVPANCNKVCKTSLPNKISRNDFAESKNEPLKSENYFTHLSEVA